MCAFARADGYFAPARVLTSVRSAIYSTVRFRVWCLFFADIRVASVRSVRAYGASRQEVPRRN